MIDFIEKVILTSLLAAGSPKVIAQTEASVRIPDGITKMCLGMFSKPLIFGCGATEDERPGVLSFQPPKPRMTWTRKTGPTMPRSYFYVSLVEEPCEGQVKSWSTQDHQGYSHPQELASASSGTGLPVCRIRHHLALSRSMSMEDLLWGPSHLQSFTQPGPLLF